jgi:transcriptional regulator with XRE-family HTH domain
VVSAHPVGERVRFWRQRRGMTQRLLADFAGISHSTLSRIESGENGADRHPLVVRLADVLRVSPTELTGEQLETDAGPVTHVGDVEVLLATGRVLVMDRRTRRPLLRLTPDGAARLTILMSAIVAAARRR